MGRLVDGNLVHLEIVVTIIERGLIARASDATPVVNVQIMTELSYLCQVWLRLKAALCSLCDLCVSVVKSR